MNGPGAGAGAERGASEAGERGPLRLAVLLSGAGRTLENLLRAIEAGELRARVVVVVSSVARGALGRRLSGRA